MHMKSSGLKIKSAASFFMLVLAAFMTACATVDTETALQKSGAHYKIGVSYLNEGKAQQAFVEFQHALELNPSNKEVIYAIGIIYLINFDETQKAMEFFQRAIQIDPSYSDAYNNLGVAHARLDRYEDAIPFYKKAVSNLFYPTPEKAYVNMGVAYYRLGRYSESIAAYKEAIKRAPGLDLAFLGLALCYNATKEYGNASAALTHAIALNPQFRNDPNRAAEYFTTRKISSSGAEQNDYADYLEILKY